MPTFNFSFDPGTSLQQMLGFEVAGRIWSSYLTDNATLNIHVGVSNKLGNNIIGGALPGMSAGRSYFDIRNQLAIDAKSADDRTATATLNSRNSSTFTARFDRFTLLGNAGTTRTTSTLNLTRANAKAMGLGVSGSASTLDGYILFSDLSATPYQWNYDYTRGSAASANSLDFLSTAIHEIGHILGFVSGVDKPGWVNSSIADTLAQVTYLVSLQERIDNATPLDLFRYSTQQGALQNDLSYGGWGGAKQFSIDGKTAIAQFATGAVRLLGGDGSQASHWKGAGTSTGIMNPTTELGSRPTVGSLDLRALDVIGWDVASTGVNTQINNSTLMAQAKQTLSSRLGQTVSWLDANSTQAAQQLAQSRITDVQAMIKDSQIYNWGSEDADPDGFWQRIQDLYNQQGLFATLDELQPASTMQLTALAKMDLSALVPNSNSATLLVSNAMTVISASSTTKAGAKGTLSATTAIYQATAFSVVNFQPLSSTTGFNLSLTTSVSVGSSTTLATRFSFQLNAQLDSKKISTSSASQFETVDWGSEDDPSDPENPGWPFW